ncbi:hypothetical protein Pint_20061 [Pistacia integerrima]|uniref:Uncharacterized protein n=1 Tax=Pistacia integerrima TaxID=434235 RepID=A0ACC0X981_9ROSI|nr:hypothetical protein Pint_20061 [Pistacia integerrima]
MSSFKMIKEKLEIMPSKQTVEEFEPYCKWQKDGRDTILHVYLNGFKKELLQFDDAKRKLTVSGYRILDQYTIQYFTRTFDVPENCEVDKNKIKFTGGILSITFPEKDSTSKGAITSITEWCFNEKIWKYVERIGMVGVAACVLINCCLCCSA